MGVPTSEVGYIWATTRRRDHDVHKGHMVALAKQYNNTIQYIYIYICFDHYCLLPRYFVNKSLLTYRFYTHEPSKAQWLLCVPPDSNLKNIYKSTFCPHGVFTCFPINMVTNSNFYPTHHKLIGFITEMASVYCAVRTSSLNGTYHGSSLKGKI
jgi:hypothetical protein